MKKVFVFLVLCSFCLNAHPFWIWSPKTQKWKNPQYSALATPYLQYKEALKLFELEDYTGAYRAFKKVLIHYPDAKEAAEAQYYLARCLEKLNKPYDAFLEYKKLINSYPNSQRINEAVEREYNVGEYFLNREHKKWLGVSFYDFVEHPSIEIFREITDKVPYSEYAPRAQYKQGTILMRLGRYDEARDAFQKVIDNYSDSEWATPAKYQLAIATYKSFPGADYDSSYLEEATERLDEFIAEHPEAQISFEAEEQLKELRDREAKKNFDIGEFYETQSQYKSAVIYYTKVVDNYPDTSYFNQSLQRIEELQELVEGDITKKELKIREIKAAVEAKRREKARLKAEKLNRKQEIRQEKLENKQIRRQQKQEFKEQRKEDKFVKVQAIKEKKETARQAKLERKQLLRQEKLEKKQLRRQQKETARQAKRARKQLLRQEKLKLKEEKREAKLRRIKELKAAKEAYRQQKPKVRQERLEQKAKEKQRALKIKQEILLQEREIKARKQEARLAKIQAVKAKKEAYRKEKLEKAQLRRQQKETARQAKRARKQLLRQEKLKLKEEKREAKLRKIQELKAKKEAQRKSRIEQKKQRLEQKKKQKPARLKKQPVKEEKTGSQSSGGSSEIFEYLTEE